MERCSRRATNVAGRARRSSVRSVVDADVTSSGSRQRERVPGARQLDERATRSKLDRGAVIGGEVERLVDLVARPGAVDVVAAGEDERLAAAKCLRIGTSGDAGEVVH